MANACNEEKIHRNVLSSCKNPVNEWTKEEATWTARAVEIAAIRIQVTTSQWITLITVSHLNKGWVCNECSAISLIKIANILIAKIWSINRWHFFSLENALSNHHGIMKASLRWYHLNVVYREIKYAHLNVITMCISVESIFQNKSFLAEHRSVNTEQNIWNGSKTDCN